MACTDHGGSTAERALIDHARAKRVPINGSLELLPLCNMNCAMCYVRLDAADVARAGGLRTPEEWLAIGRQMREAGVLFLLLTGGEPLLYPGFRQVYAALREMGFILTINTNGTLIDEDWAAFFGAQPPRRVNITLYGAGEDDYARLCRYPEGYARTVRGIRLLRERGVDVKVSISLTKANIESMERVFAIGAELGVPVHIDPYMMPAVRERNRPFAQQARALPEDAAAASLRAMQLQFPPEIMRQYVAQAIARVDDPAFPRGDGHISCMAGNCSFTINWQGMMRPCVVMSEPQVSVLERGFAPAWRELSAATQCMTYSPTCTACRYKPICKVCVAAANLETGRNDGVPEYLCRYCEAYYRELVALREELGE